MTLTLPAWSDLIGLPLAVIALGLFSLGLGWLFYRRVKRRLAALDAQISAESQADIKAQAETDASDQGEKQENKIMQANNLFGEALIYGAPNVKGAVLVKTGAAFATPKSTNFIVEAADGTRMVFTTAGTYAQKTAEGAVWRKPYHSNILPARATPRERREAKPVVNSD